MTGVAHIYRRSDHCEDHPEARAEAIERKLKLQAEADVIGKDALGMREIVSNIPALALQDFLGPVFLEFFKKRASISASAVTGK